MIASACVDLGLVHCSSEHLECSHITALIKSADIEKKRKGYTFRRQFNEKPSIILGCPGQQMYTHESNVIILTSAPESASALLARSSSDLMGKDPPAPPLPATHCPAASLLSISCRTLLMSSRSLTRLTRMAACSIASVHISANEFARFSSF